jgi:riboflavin synthase
MFTGIVEEIGVVKESVRDHLTIEASKVLGGTEAGDSIAVNGVCLTVASLEKRRFSANIMPATLLRTNLGLLHFGDRVNLESALTLGARIGGHLVLGHIDDTGQVMDMTDDEGGRIMRISTPTALMPYVVDKGSVAIDGVSLTVAAMDALSFYVSLVTHTIEHTTLGMKRPGDRVNLETDILAKYVQRLMEHKRHDLTSEFLSKYGFGEGSDAG